MDGIARCVIKYRKPILFVFVSLAIACACLIPFVNVNYDDTHYLPEDSNTKTGIQQMTRAFGDTGSAAYLLDHADIAESMRMKARLQETEGVKHVVWLDDILLPLTSAGRDKLKQAGTPISDERAVELMLRALNSLPDSEDAKPTDILLAWNAQFDMADMQALMTMFTSADALKGLGMSGMAAGAEPLGAEYATLVSEMRAQLDSFYKDEHALYQIVFEKGDYDKLTSSALAQIDALSEHGYLSGNAAATYFSQRNILREIIEGTATVGVVALVVLFLFSSAWIEPVLYIAVTAIAVALNMGSNIFLRNGVSYLTHSIASIMQMVLSIDYAIFLLTRYKKERKLGKAPEDAMKEALKRSLAPISASALTTVACFITIMFMKYRMGLDMGLVMSKGILLSLICAFVLMPGIIVMADKALSRSQHASLSFKGKGFARFVHRARVPIAIITLALMLPAAYFANNNRFFFGVMASQGEDSPAVVNLRIVEDVFSTQQQLALLVPEGDDEAEAALTRELAAMPGVKSAMSYASVNENGYASLMPEATKNMLDGEGMRRIILYLDVPEEGELTNALLEDIEASMANAYGEDADVYLLGNTAAARDMEESTHTDYSRISWLSLIAVALIVGLAFRSPILPVLLVCVIEGGIWLNMSIPYLIGDKMAFIGYMIIVNVLLGSTIDYAILMTSNYLEARESLAVNEAVCEAHSRSLPALLTSAGIFTLGGAVICIVMSVSTVRMFGLAILRGGLCALFMTLVVLPALLSIFDKPILKVRLKRGTKRDKHASNP